jgi:4-hydroxy-3-polyprenylbenzoate decarboxylase
LEFGIFIWNFLLPTFAPMAFKNQQQFIDVLEKNGELVRIKEYVDPKLEIAEITDRISKTTGGGKALLFENTGYDFPVLMNALWQ